MSIRAVAAAVLLTPIAAVVITGVACASVPVAHSFPELPRTVRVGQTVTITDTDGVQTEGVVNHLAADAITMRVGGAPREVHASRVVKITRRVGHAGVGALVGGAAGLAGGLVAGAGEPSGNPYVDTQAAAGTVFAGALLGTAVGAGIGAMARSDRVIYEAPRP
jgi:hypothetical protein